MSFRFGRAEDKQSIMEMMAYCFPDYQNTAPESRMAESVQVEPGFLSGQDVAESGMMAWRTETARPLFDKVFQKRPTAQWIPF